MLTEYSRKSEDWRMRRMFAGVVVTGSLILIMLRVLSPSEEKSRIKSNFTITYWDPTPHSQLGLDFQAKYEVRNSSYKFQQHSIPYLKIKTGQSFNNRCSKRLQLRPFSISPAGSEAEMFFLETTGRSWLTPREACALESAAKFSRLRVNIIFTSPFMDTFDNSTCYLYKTVDNIHFYTIQLKEIFGGTPLEGFHTRASIRESKFRQVHLSDALRLALIYKAGGFYSDLDTVTIRDLSGHQNVIGATYKDGNTTLPHLANGDFHFKRKHPLLLFTMQGLAKIYRGKKRTEVGPLLITQATRMLYKVTDVGTLQTSQITVMPPSFFYPAKSFEVGSLWTEKPMAFSDWFLFLENSTMVHFYGSQTNKLVVERNPSHELYALLGPRYCPVSYWSSTHF